MSHSPSLPGPHDWASLPEPVQSIAWMLYERLPDAGKRFGQAKTPPGVLTQQRIASALEYCLAPYAADPQAIALARLGTLEFALRWLQHWHKGHQPSVEAARDALGWCEQIRKCIRDADGQDNGGEGEQ